MYLAIRRQQQKRKVNKTWFKADEAAKEARKQEKILDELDNFIEDKYFRNDS